MPEKITPTNINLLNMTEKVRQRRKSTVEYDRKQKIKIIPLRRPTFMCEYDQKYKIKIVIYC